MDILRRLRAFYAVALVVLVLGAFAADKLERIPPAAAWFALAVMFLVGVASGVGRG